MKTNDEFMRAKLESDLEPLLRSLTAREWKALNGVEMVFARRGTKTLLVAFSTRSTRQRGKE